MVRGSTASSPVRSRTSARRVAGVAASLASTLLLTACGSDGGAAGSQQQDAAAAATTCDEVDLTKAPVSPVKIRVGRGRASEEPLWLMDVNKKANKHSGSFYELDMQPFDSTETRLVAYQAGQLDAVTVAPQVLVTGTARGRLDLAALVTIMREAEEGAFGTTFVSKVGSGIEDFEDLKGKKIGIVGLNTDPDYLAKLGVQKGGADPNTGAQYVVLPFPAQGEALKNGSIDVASLAEPFYSAAKAQGGVQDVFTARDVTGYGLDLLTVGFDKGFIAANPAAVCAFRADFQTQMAYYKSDTEAAKKQLAGTEYVKTPLPVYLKLQDYARPDDGNFDPAGFEKLIDTSIELKLFRPSDKIDVSRLYVPGITAGIPAGQ